MIEQTTSEDFQGSSDFRAAEVHLADGTVELLERQRLEEPLFRFAARDQMLNAHHMLQALLHQTKSSLQDFIPQSTLDEAVTNGEARIQPLFQADIARGGFQYLQNGKLVDFDKLVFAVELVVRHESPNR